MRDFNSYPSGADLVGELLVTQGPVTAEMIDFLGGLDRTDVALIALTHQAAETRASGINRNSTGIMEQTLATSGTVRAFIDEHRQPANFATLRQEYQ
jgi:hypothetical protein